MSKEIISWVNSSVFVAKQSSLDSWSISHHAYLWSLLSLVRVVHVIELQSHSYFLKVLLARSLQLSLCVCDQWSGCHRCCTPYHIVTLLYLSASSGRFPPDTWSMKPSQPLLSHFWLRQWTQTILLTDNSKLDSWTMQALSFYLEENFAHQMSLAIQSFLFFSKWLGYWL